MTGAQKTVPHGLCPAAIPAGVVLLLGVLALMVGCVHLQPTSGSTRLEIRVGRPFVIAGSSRPLGWGRYSHPVLWRLPSRCLVLLYNAHGDLPGSPGGQLLSCDGGISWQELQVSLGRERDLWGCIARPDGSCLVYSREMRKSGGEQDRFLVAACTVSPSGEWGPRQDIEIQFGVPLDRGELSPYGLSVPNGRLLVPFYGAVGREKKYTVLLLASDDGGRHFRTLSVVARPGDAPWGTHGPAEPSLVRLPDGRLLCMMRTGSYASYSEKGGSAKMLLAESSDGGRTWKKRFFPRPGVRPRLLLMSNGVLVCAFGRPGNNLMFSTDFGRTWGREIRLTPADARSTGYVGLAEVEPGKLLAVYDLYNTSPRRFWLWEPPQERNVIYGVFVAVQRRR